MDHEYDMWNMLKKKLNTKTTPIYANTREIWWCSFGLNIGTELYGKHELFERPILILKVFNKETLKVVPLTTKGASKQFYTPVTYGTTTSYASFTQVKTISTKRLSRKIGRIDRVQFEEIVRQYKASF